MLRTLFTTLLLAALAVTAAACSDAGSTSPATAGSAETAAAQDLPTVTVYKSPTCGCCQAWADHMTEAGFPVKTTDMPDVAPVKRRLGLPASLGSCHTAVVDGYVVEGHVPADVVKTMLADRPDIAGIAVPGMPIGSPGMEVEGRTPEQYDVVAFDGHGNTSVYARR